jgi:hypothetical protein
VAVVGGDQRQLELLAEPYEHFVEGPVFGEGVVLELHEEIARLERVTQLRERFASNRRPLVQDLLRDVPTHARAQSDDALVVLPERLEVDSRLVVGGHSIDPAGADQTHQVVVPLLRAGE